MHTNTKEPCSQNCKNRELQGTSRIQLMKKTEHHGGQSSPSKVLSKSTVWLLLPFHNLARFIKRPHSLQIWHKSTVNWANLLEHFLPQERSIFTRESTWPNIYPQPLATFSPYPGAPSRFFLTLKRNFSASPKKCSYLPEIPTHYEPPADTNGYNGKGGVEEWVNHCQSIIHLSTERESNN